MEGSKLHRERSPFYLVLALLLQGRGSTFTINCSGFDHYGVDPSILNPVFERKAFRPVTDISVPTRVNISFTMSAILDVDEQLQLLSSFLWLEMVWDNPFISWNPEECKGIAKFSIAAKNLWLPDIFIVESIDVDKTPKDLKAYVSNEGRIEYNEPMKVTSVCNLDIFYFPFDQQNCTLTFRSFVYTAEHLVLGMEKEVWELTDVSREIVQAYGEWELLSIKKATPKMSVGPNLYDQIAFYVSVRRRPSLYIINLLMPSSFLVAIDAISFYLPAESENRAPFKITLLLGYNVFLLMMNDLLPTNGTSLISVYFAVCLSLMVVSLLETVFITYMLYLATTQPPPMPRWLQALLLHCTRPRRCCPTAPRKGNKDLGLVPTHLPDLKEPAELVGTVPGPREAGSNGCPESVRAQHEREAQKQHLIELWVQFSLMMDTLLFCLYLLLLASSIITVIVLWNT
ncbi:PREDICTED: 5-hydroxytryptamine receptor 3E-like isoform X1 [Galeopterus variegatus]|uniref:5-hydroxytryptamine receptor 3E-like isoform X1 n=1 Tax=Galeopterus variegatus TaxID=482537 RepID=A0ABM0QVN6_GALVR|nr:PREDICTED: 5-hydroxytryptamine receptor 3E-like isoform X1 [Galeopterus variegatus]